MTDTSAELNSKKRLLSMDKVSLSRTMTPESQRDNIELPETVPKMKACGDPTDVTRTSHDPSKETTLRSDRVPIEKASGADVPNASIETP